MTKENAVSIQQDMEVNGRNADCATSHKITVYMVRNTTLEKLRIGDN